MDTPLQGHCVAGELEEAAQGERDDDTAEKYAEKQEVGVEAEERETAEEEGVAYKESVQVSNQTMNSEQNHGCKENHGAKKHGC